MNISKQNSFGNSSDDLLKTYLKEISQYPVLSEIEELETFKEYREGNRDLRLKLIHANLRLVVSVAKKYTDNGIEFLDLIQEGNLGLFKAVDRFDIDKNLKFSTYAVFWIKQSILQTISNKSRMIRYPIHITDAIVTLKKVEKSFLNNNKRLPEDSELVEILDWTLEKVEKIKALSIDNNTISLDSTTTSNTNEEESSLKDYLKVDDNVIKEIMSADLKKTIESALECLNERERNVIDLRFGLTNNQQRTLQEIADYYGNITRERVRQIEANALKKIRNSKLLE